MNQELEIRRVTSEMEAEVKGFFDVLAKAGEEHFFMPHPFTSEYAYTVANYRGKDFYALVLYNSIVIGYGFLRGWEEGYEIPSLGISIHPDYRGRGIGLAFICYLHAVAMLRDCKKVRLRVNKGNNRAKILYENLGYQFEEDKDNELYLIGFLELKQLCNK